MGIMQSNKCAATDIEERSVRWSGSRWEIGIGQWNTEGDRNRRWTGMGGMERIRKIWKKNWDCGWARPKFTELIDRFKKDLSVVEKGPKKGGK